MFFFKQGFNEKIVYAVALVVALGVVFIYSEQKEKSVPSMAEQSVPVATTEVEKSEIAALEKNTEDKISQCLANIQGVGKAEVLVTYTSGIKRVYAYDKSVITKTSKQTDKDGGISEVEEITETSQLVIAGNSAPVVIAEQRPEIAGVLIIAQGAGDPKIKEQISLAVRTLLNIEPTKVSVVPMADE
ncbi:MAG: stage III sporulation protein AG [Peptococcaceae bacterium]|nr:stage III sporulation protein AG [Peptococcaceae bacterium]